MKQGTKLKSYSGKAIPIPGNDIDTDRIIPARFMRCLTFCGLGQYAMYDERYNQDGSEKEHLFNKDEYKRNSILLVNKNFGCGSSREHAPWALHDFGTRLIIGESFAEIFAGNCNSLGIPAVTVSKEIVTELMTLVGKKSEIEINVDLENKKLSAQGKSWPFDMPETYRLALVDGKWDTTAILMENLDKVKEKKKELVYLNW